MRGTVRREVVIEAPADRVWAVAGDAERLAEWVPGIESVKVEGDHRFVTVGSGLTFDELIVTQDHLQRRFQYAIQGGIFTEHLSTLDVVAIDEGRCLVTYGVDADPAPMALIIAGAMGAGLEELRRQLEGAS